MISRRGFLKTLAGIAPILGGAGLCLSSPVWERFLAGDAAGCLFALDPKSNLIRLAPLARFWTSVPLAGADCRLCHVPLEGLQGKRIRHEAGIVKCLLCAQGCVLRAGDRGRCRARMNVGGELRSLVYGRPISIHVDPIEKKPFYHFLPGAAAYSLATSGCPLRCKFCQNWEISQASPEDYESPTMSPELVVRNAVKKQAPVIAFTYNEPTVFAEYMIDIAREAKKQGRRSVLISCGIMNEAPLSEFCEILDAIKIDLKGYDEAFYRDVCGAELKPVLRSIKQIAKSRAHLEIVNLVVPTLNDSEKMLLGLIDWVLGEAGPTSPSTSRASTRITSSETCLPRRSRPWNGPGRRRWSGGCTTSMSETSRTIRGTIPTVPPAGRRSSNDRDSSPWKCMSPTAAAVSVAEGSSASGVDWKGERS